MANKMNYKGEQVYIGVDVHKRHYSVCCVHSGVVVKSGRVPATYDALYQFMIRYFEGGKIHSAYEAGFSGFGLHRFLVGRGVTNFVVNPASIEVAARDKVKTDKRDAKKVAIQLAAGRLKSVRVPSIEQENKRLLTRTREQLVSQKTRLGLQIKSRLFQFGLIGPDDRTPVGEKLFERCLATELSTELKSALSFLIEQWRFVAKQIKEMRRLMSAQAKSDPLEQVYRSVPGIGEIGARILANELGDMSQFRSEKRAFSFIGFTSSESSSGDSRIQGHITRQGSARLRWILVEAAWRAIRIDPNLKDTYLRIAGNAGGKKAIVAVARKLVGRIRACFRKHESYQMAFAG